MKRLSLFFCLAVFLSSCCAIKYPEGCVSSKKAFYLDKKTHTVFLPELQLEALQAQTNIPSFPSQIGLNIDSLKIGTKAFHLLLRSGVGPQCPIQEEAKWRGEAVKQVIGIGFDNILKNIVVRDANTSKILSKNHELKRVKQFPVYYLSTVDIDYNLMEGKSVDIEYVYENNKNFMVKGIEVADLARLKN